MHWHRWSNLSEKCMSTSRVYREKDHPVKYGVANESGLGEMLYLTAATKQSALIVASLSSSSILCDTRSVSRTGGDWGL